jgi:hypothetical protein
MFHWFIYTDTKWDIVHRAQGTLIYTPSSKPTCHKKCNPKNNYTSLSQIIFFCAAKLKYDSYFIYIYLYIYTHTHTHMYIHTVYIYVHTYTHTHIYIVLWMYLLSFPILYCSNTIMAMHWKLKSVFTTNCTCLSESKHTKIQPITGQSAC